MVGFECLAPDAKAHSQSMFDLEISLEDRPGELARMGEALTKGSISVEGGGVWVTGGRGVGHFLFEDGGVAKAALEGAGVQVRAVREVTMLRLDEARPGQLGAVCRLMGDSGVNIAVQYSDHHNQLVLVTDNPRLAQAMAEEWRCGSRRVPGT